MCYRQNKTSMGMSLKRLWVLTLCWLVAKLEF